MSISNVSGSNLFSLSDLGGIGSINQTSATVSFSDAPPPRPPGGGGGSFMDAIKQVLEALGADTATSSAIISSSSDDTTSTQNVDTALNAFLQNLMSALHSESASTSASDNGADAQSASSASAVAAATAASSTGVTSRPPPPPPGSGPGEGRLESDITKLVQSLSSSDASSSSTDTTTASDASSSSSSTTNSDLESSFENLLSALGDSGSTSLSSFLQNIASKLHATPSSGNIINTTA